MINVIYDWKPIGMNFSRHSKLCKFFTFGLNLMAIFQRSYFIFLSQRDEPEVCLELLFSTSNHPTYQWLYWPGFGNWEVEVKNHSGYCWGYVICQIFFVVFVRESKFELNVFITISYKRLNFPKELVHAVFIYIKSFRPLCLLKISAATSERMFPF